MPVAPDNPAESPLERGDAGALSAASGVLGAVSEIEPDGSTVGRQLGQALAAHSKSEPSFPFVATLALPQKRTRCGPPFNAGRGTR